MEHPVLVSYLRWIVLLPLLGAIINGVGGALIQKHIGKTANHTIAVGAVGLAFVLSLMAFVQVYNLEPDQRFLLDTTLRWIDLGDLQVDIAFWVDPLSAVMILVVTGIGGLIHIYSIGYMHEDDAYWRFFTFLNLFTAAMLTLVLADNMLLLFVGWEGVGLCSYALIGFWYKEQANTSAANKAFIVNRIGDAGFTLGVFTIFWALSSMGHGSAVFRDMEAHIGVLNDPSVALFGVSAATLAALFLFIGAAGKSAQIPLYVWLPDAMAGPTPVSALIHAATMVTAGVYMMCRMHFLFSLSPTALQVIATVGALTAVLAATIGLAQNDIKKVLAYSTVSQLGYMVLGVGVGAYAAAFFHVFTHAFFKACLFLGSGSVIHAMGDEQDMQKMGGLKAKMPLTYWTFLISTLALMGLPPFSGFFSKDEILWKTFSGGHQVLWLLGFLGAGMTAFYMGRQVFLVFFGENRADHHTQEHLHESPPVMTYPLVVLAVGAVVVGLLGIPHALGGSLRFEQWLEPVFSATGHGAGHGAAAAHDAHGHGAPVVEYVLMLASVGIALVGVLLSARLYYWKTLSPDVFASLGGGRLYTTIFNKYYVDELYAATFVRFSLLVSWLWSAFDRIVIDGIVDGTAKVVAGVGSIVGMFDNGIIDGLINLSANATFAMGNRLRQVQTGGINVYLYVIVGGVAAAQFLPRLAPQTLINVALTLVAVLVVIGLIALFAPRRPARPAPTQESAV